jgi:hypothetical protein
MIVEMTPKTMKINQTWRKMLPMVNPSVSSSSLSHEYERLQQKEVFFRYSSHPHLYSQSVHHMVSCPEGRETGHSMVYDDCWRRRWPCRRKASTIFLALFLFCLKEENLLQDTQL